MARLYDFFKSQGELTLGLALLAALIVAVLLAYITSSKCKLCGSRQTNPVRQGSIECHSCGAIVTEDGKIFRSPRDKVVPIEDFRDRAAG